MPKAHVRRRGNSWQARWTEPRTRRQRTKAFCGPGAEEAARKHAERVIALINLGLYKPPNRDPQWRVFLKEYRNRVIEPQSYENAVMHLRSVTLFQKITGFTHISRVTSGDVENFIATRKRKTGKHKEPLSPATINKDLRYINTMLRTANEWGYLERIPKIKLLREIERVKTYINEEEFQAIYNACPNAWWKAFLLFFFMTGWRFSQVLRLRWYNVDLETGDILSNHYDTKGKRDVVLPLHKMIWDAIREHKADPNRLKTDFVFAYKDEDIRKTFQQIQERAGIKPRNKRDGEWYTFHDLRRGFATLNADRLDLFELQKLMNHRDIKTTLGYVNMAHRLRPAVEKIVVPKLESDPVFVPAEDNENMIQRIVRGEIEIGICPVVFGMRVRAGYVGSMGFNIDWCCGDSQQTLEWCYAAAKKILSSQSDFQGIPPHSEIKPVVKDFLFIAKIGQLIEGSVDVEPLPPIAELRERFFRDKPAIRSILDQITKESETHADGIP
jgi:integrase